MLYKKSASVGMIVSSVMFLLSGCASIMHGSGQDVGISSNPSGAKVQIDGKNVGTTPLVRNLARRSTHEVIIEKTGYQPYSATFTNHLSGWVWGNLVFGGLIGLGVDAGTGGMYNLSPKQVTADLVPYRQTSSNQALQSRADPEPNNTQTRIIN